MFCLGLNNSNYLVSEVPTTVFSRPMTPVSLLSSPTTLMSIEWEQESDQFLRRSERCINLYSHLRTEASYIKTVPSNDQQSSRTLNFSRPFSRPLKRFASARPVSPASSISSDLSFGSIRVMLNDESDPIVPVPLGEPVDLPTPGLRRRGGAGHRKESTEVEYSDLVVVNTAVEKKSRRELKEECQRALGLGLPDRALAIRALINGARYSEVIHLLA